MNIYYIDYENVTSLGLKGIELLSEEDEVNLLYSKKAETMKIDMLTQLMASRAKINFLPVHVGTPNALDFQLITLLFLHYSEGNNYYIISKDSGYDCCIKTAAEHNAPNVSRFPNIESAVSGKQKPKTQRGRRGSGSRQNQQDAENTANSAVSADAAAEAQAQTSEPTDKKPESEGSDLSKETGNTQASVNESVQSTPSETEKGESAQSAQTPAADHSSQEEPARKRSSRRRGRRKSASSDADAETSDVIPADGRSQSSNRQNAKEDGQNQGQQSGKEETGKQSQRPQQNVKEDAQKQPQRSQQNGKDNVQKQSQRNSKEDTQKQSQRPQQNGKSEADKNDRPVTILSVIRRRNDVQLDLNQIDMIRDALKTASNKQQFYSYFVKKLGQKRGIELYHSIKSSYTDLINSNLM